MTALLEAIRTLPDQSRAFMVVSTAVAVLLVLSLLFTAYAAWLRARNAIRQRVWRDRESRWTSQTLEFVAGERSIEDLLARVDRRERLPFLDFLLRYARRLRGRERERVKELAAPFLPALRRLSRDRDAYRRARAVQTLGTLGGPDQRDTLVQALDDPSPFVSMLAARALAAYGGTSYAEPILANLDRFEAWGTEYVESLLVSLGPEAAPQIRSALGDEGRSDEVRVTAADALGELHDLEAVPAALAILATKPGPDLTAALLRLLRVLGGPEHAGVVRDLLDHEHFAVRAEAYSALGSLGPGSDDARLEAGVEDASPWVALHAARALRARGKSAWLEGLSRSDSRAALAAGQVLAEE